MGEPQPVEVLLKTQERETKMRRISIAMTLALLVPSLAQADYNAPLRYRVQYNPYAFGYHSNGLVPGGIKYTPYAFKAGSSGLVFEGVRYIPYAFTYKSTGLVLDYYWYPIPYAVYSPSCAPDQVYPMYNRVQPCDRRDSRTVNKGYRSRSYYQSRDTATATEGDDAVASAERQDTITVIRQYLRERGISDVGINRILRVDDKLVSADFTVGGRNLLIKYWDPTQTEPKETQADSKRASTSSVGAKMIEKYKKDWEAFAGKYQQDGGEIYVIAASGRTDIVAALDACTKLGPGDAKPAPRTMYAKQ
jgi:hypothetical protein